MSYIYVCDTRQTSSVACDSVFHAEVRVACLQLDISKMSIYHLPYTFSCFHGVLVPSVVDEMVIEQQEVKYIGQGEVSD